MNWNYLEAKVVSYSDSELSLKGKCQKQNKRKNEISKPEEKAKLLTVLLFLNKIFIKKNLQLLAM